MTYWFLENTHSRSACPRLSLPHPASLAHHCPIPHTLRGMDRRVGTGPLNNILGDSYSFFFDCLNEIN